MKHGKRNVRVPWEHILGHKNRKPLMFFLYDQGEDGAIVKDEKGEKHYVHGYKQEETMQKSVTLLFLKDMVQAHTRTLPSGRTILVNAYMKRFAKLSDAIDHMTAEEMKGKESFVYPKGSEYVVESR